MSVRDTSLLAYIRVKSDAEKLAECQQEVYDWILPFNGITDKEISKSSGIPINIVTARRNDLIKKGKVASSGKRACSVTGHKATIWVALVDDYSNIEDCGGIYGA